jgi:hypothetical protein
MPFAAQAAGGSHAGPQLSWQYAYIRSVYGNPVNAANHERAFNWYGNGLHAIANSRTLIGVGEHGRERVDVTPLTAARSAPPVPKVVLQFQPTGSSEFDRFMTSWLTKSVQVKGGGSVQVAFGSEG